MGPALLGRVDPTLDRRRSLADSSRREWRGLNDFELLSRIQSLKSFKLGDKGFVKTWMKSEGEKALGIIVFPALDRRIGPWGLTEITHWGVHRVLVKIDNDDVDAAFDKAIEWLDTHDEIELPSKTIRTDFAEWTVAQILEHHRKLSLQANSWEDNRLASNFELKFLDQHSFAKWGNRIQKEFKEEERVKLQNFGNTFLIEYRFVKPPV